MEKPKCPFCQERHWSREPCAAIRVEKPKPVPKPPPEKKPRAKPVAAPVEGGRKVCPHCGGTGFARHASAAERQRAYRERKKRKAE